MKNPQETNTQEAEELSLPPQVQEIIKACLSHAADLLAAAIKTHSELKLSNIAYHLAALALEEVGKADLVAVNYIATSRDGTVSWPEKHADDHVKKLFWALWGPSFGRQVINQEQIDSFKGLAQRIHETRLKGLYVNPAEDELLVPRDVVTETEAQWLISLAQSRLKLESLFKPKILTEEEKNDLSWFLNASGDVDKRRFIFTAESMNKLAELGQVSKWIHWLKEQFDKAEAEGRAMAERELRRQAPSETEAADPKWKLKTRLYTNSHSIRPKALNWWNGVSNWIKLFPVDKKKDQLLVEFTLPKSMSAQTFWWNGWGVSRRFVVALNMGSFGFFWWYVPEQISRYYEKLTDLEQNTEVRIERSPILKLDWRAAALSEQDLQNAALCFGMFPSPNERERNTPFDHYIAGLAFLSKNDIHLQFEFNSYEQFYKSLKSGMRLYGDWDGLTPAEGAIDAVLADLIRDAELRRKHIRFGEQLEASPSTMTGITLSEVGEIKLFCDAYFLRTFRRIAEKSAQEKNNGQN